MTHALLRKSEDWRARGYAQGISKLRYVAARRQEYTREGKFQLTPV